MFVSTNKLPTGKKILELVEEKTLKTVLTDTYKVRLIEGKARSSRYGKKLKERIFGEEIAIPHTDSDATDYQHAKSVGAIVKKSTCKSLDLTKPEAIAKALNTPGKIYVITERLGGKGPNPHAEEFLVDIRKAVKSSIEHSAIAGKKRPCMGCSGTMSGVISNYNLSPGYFWLDTIKHKAKTDAEKILTVLREEDTHVSICKNKKTTTTEYDSGSDSECEDLKTTPTLK